MRCIKNETYFSFMEKSCFRLLIACILHNIAGKKKMDRNIAGHVFILQHGLN